MISMPKIDLCGQKVSLLTVFLFVILLITMISILNVFRFWEQEQFTEENVKQQKKSASSKSSFVLQNGDEKRHNIHNREHHTVSTTSSSETDKWCQADSNRCYSARCYSPPNYFDGGCLASPYYHLHQLSENNLSSSSSPLTKKIEQLALDCPDRKDQRHILKRRRSKHKNKNNNNNNPQDDVPYRFKNATSWMYPKWFDWSGKCFHNPNGTTRKDLELRGFHDRKDGLYRLQNVCVKPNGNFAGYVRPNKKHERVLENFRGADDVFTVTRVIESPFNFMFHQWQEAFAYSQAPAPCYLDTKVVLFPVYERSQNIGHAYYRSHSMLRVIEAAFGKDAMLQKDNVTVMYLLADPKGRKLVQNKENMMNSFYEVLGTSWFSVDGPEVTQSFSHRHQFPVLPYLDKIDPEQYTCFKEIVIWQNAHVPKKQTMYGMLASNANPNAHPWANNPPLVDAAVDIPGASTSFHMFISRTVRDAETAQIMDEMLRSCAKVPPKRKMRKPSVDPVKILFMARSKWRKFLLQPYMIGHIGEMIEQRMMNMTNKSNNNNRKYSLEVIALESFRSFKEILIKFSEADVVIGMYGALLTFASLMMPPGSIIFEFNTARFRYSKLNGISKSPQTEFGGASMITGVHHILVADNKHLNRFMHPIFVHGAIDLLNSPRIFTEFFFQKIDCLMFPTIAGNRRSRDQRIAATNDTTLTYADDDLNLPLADHFEKEINIERIMKLLRTHPQGVDAHTSPFALEEIVPFPRKCDYGIKEYTSLVLRQFQEDFGSNDGIIRQLGSTNLKESERELLSFSASLRVRSMMKFHQVVADSLNFLVGAKRVETLPTTSILLVEPCEARYSVLAESKFLKSIFIKADTVMVAEYAAGRTACEKMKRSRTQLYQEIWKQKKKINSNNEASLKNQPPTAVPLPPAAHQRAQRARAPVGHMPIFSSPPSTAVNLPLHPLDAASFKTREQAHAKPNASFEGLQTRNFYVDFCHYPCAELGSFNLILAECGTADTDQEKNEDDCQIKGYHSSLDRVRAAELGNKRAERPIFEMPKLSQIFKECGNQFTTIFGFLEKRSMKQRLESATRNSIEMEKIMDNGHRDVDHRLKSVRDDDIIPDLFVSKLISKHEHEDFSQREIASAFRTAFKKFNNNQNHPRFQQEIESIVNESHSKYEKHSPFLRKGQMISDPRLQPKQQNSDNANNGEKHNPTAALSPREIDEQKDANEDDFAKNAHVDDESVLKYPDRDLLGAPQQQERLIADRAAGRQNVRKRGRKSTFQYQ